MSIIDIINIIKTQTNPIQFIYDLQKEIDVVLIELKKDLHKNEKISEWIEISKDIVLSNVKQQDETSFKNLLYNELSQSGNIKLGIYLEKCINNMIEKKGDWQNIRKKIEKGHKQTDILYMKNDNIIYAEIKGNLNLDTEKSKITDEKIGKIIDILQIEYKDKKIEGFIVNTRYLRVSDFPKKITKKYTNILLGIDDLLEKFNVDTFKNYDNYKSFVNYCANKLN